MINVKAVNFEDLYEVFYVDTEAASAANTLKGVREGLLSLDATISFPSASEIEQSSAILFSPMGNLLKFYSLLEIALIIKFIPEPEYTNKFWQETAANLAFPSIKSYEESKYPVLLPQFLLGRLEGRLHLEEEGVDSRFPELFDIFHSFASLAQRWRHPDVEIFLRFVLSRDTDQAQLDAFREFVGNRNDFMSRILATRSVRGQFNEYLMHGLSTTLGIFDDLDRLLGDAEPFPLLQSAIWNYHADLFWAADKRLPLHLTQVVESFSEWVSDEPESERALEVLNYISDVKQFMDGLGSGAYGNALSPDLLRPRVMA